MEESTREIIPPPLCARLPQWQQQTAMNETAKRTEEKKKREGRERKERAEQKEKRMM
jgi:hypothetical protein